MNFNHPSKGGSTIVTRTVCAIVFMTFSFCWLFFFQADVLSVVQYTLSGGQTTYNRLVGAVVITGLLQLLQLGVYALIRLSKRYHALTYLPSMLILGVLTDITFQSSPITLHPSPITIIIIILLWLGCVFVARGIQPYEDDRSGGILSRRMWINMLVMLVMMVGVTLIGNSNAVFHFRTHAETALSKGDVDEALRVGNSSHESDASLTMLRAYALSKKGLLGERLFCYPVVGTSDDILMLGSDARMVLYPVDSFYRHLGALPRHGMDAEHYLRNLQRGGQATAAVADYVLCGHLVDRDLDAFAADITKYYQISDSTSELPRHYREALVLYTHLRSHPRFVYHDTVMDEDYEDLQQLEAQHPEPSDCKNQVRDKYEDSYWYYYEYMK
jgi:hypothetical protein